MARIKSLLIGAQLDHAIHSHNCQANETHRINAGDARLKVRNGRSSDYYCSDCAKRMIERGIADLQLLQRDFQVY
jgi:hypothetical protein